MRNNGGFTLVEMLVSLALVAIVCVAASAMLSTGMREYSNVHDMVQIQYDSQLTTSQLQEFLRDCNGGIAWDGTTLSIVNYDGEEVVLHAFSFFPEAMEAYYGTATVPLAKIAELSVTPSDTLTERVSAIDVTPFFEGNAPQAENPVIDSISFAMTFEREDRQTDTRQSIALRNQPLFETTLADLLTAMQAA